MSRSIYIIAGEVSGDTHGAHLMQALADQVPDVTFHGVGGPDMRAVAGDGVEDWIEDAAVMGLWEVLKHYSWFKKRFYEMLEHIVEINPSVLVLVDYPGFNLRFAKAVREKLPKIKIVYYISPQVWAWNKGRIPQMAKLLDLMLCIFPFEKKIFESAGLKTVFVGHPLVDEMAEVHDEDERETRLVGLFPGSREREVDRLFPLMVEVARRMHSNHPEWKYEASAANKKLAEKMQAIVQKGKLPSECDVTIQIKSSHSLMQRATCGVVASGTATLEAAVLGLPYCLVYKLSWPTWLLGKWLVKIKYIGLINILAEKKVVEELVQSDAEPGRVSSLLTELMENPEEREALQDELQKTARKLGAPGAHVRAAEEIAHLLT